MFTFFQAQLAPVSFLLLNHPQLSFLHDFGIAVFCPLICTDNADRTSLLSLHSLLLLSGVCLSSALKVLRCGSLISLAFIHQWSDSVAFELHWIRHLIVPAMRATALAPIYWISLYLSVRKVERLLFLLLYFIIVLEWKNTVLNKVTEVQLRNLWWCSFNKVYQSIGERTDSGRFKDSRY